MGKVFTYTIAGLMAVLLLFMLSLALGSVSIPIQDIIAILLGKGEGVANPSYSYIVLESRLPQAFTALLAGAALSVSGLLLQTTFRNPLAFGISRLHTSLCSETSKASAFYTCRYSIILCLDDEPCST